MLTLLYHALSGLQITLLHPATLWLVALALAIGVAAGVVAGIGGRWTRTCVLALSATAWLDVTLSLPTVFAGLTPSARAARSRDRQRIADIHAVQQALERYIAEHGALPVPSAYGEQAGPPTFWEDWWDVSTVDRNGDGRFLLDFLSTSGLMPEVPVDPVNTPAPDGHPASGSQYAYLVVPPGYGYKGGQCAEHARNSTYLLAVTDLEGQHTRPTRVGGSGCACLWRDEPDFFQQHFDFVVCGRFPAKGTAR